MNNLKTEIETIILIALKDPPSIYEENLGYALNTKR